MGPRKPQIMASVSFKISSIRNFGIKLSLASHRNAYPEAFGIGSM